MPWWRLVRTYKFKKDLPGLQQKVRDLLHAHSDSAIGWAALANVEIEQGAKADALVALQTAVDLKSTDAKVWCDGIAYNYRIMGEMDKAITAYREVVRLDPTNDRGWNALGYALMLRGKVDEAIRDYQNAIDVNPRNPDPLYNLTDAYQQQGRWNAANEVWDKLVAVDPSQANQLRGKFPNPMPASDPSAASQTETSVTPTSTTSTTL